MKPMGKKGVIMFFKKNLRTLLGRGKMGIQISLLLLIGLGVLGERRPVCKARAAANQS